MPLNYTHYCCALRPSVAPKRLTDPALTARLAASCSQWYFCTATGSDKAAFNCIEMPTYNEETALFLCSVPHGARPSFAE